MQSDSRLALDPGAAVAIRRAARADADAIAQLSGELGYPTDRATMARRIQALSASADHAVFVACRADRLVGWIHVAAVRHLQADTRAEIGGLVVASEVRGERIGARLVRAAEEWAADAGLATIVVRSQIAREAAHRFYEREGYARTKTSAVFTKSLTPER